MDKKKVTTVKKTGTGEKRTSKKSVSPSVKKKSVKTTATTDIIKSGGTKVNKKSTDEISKQRTLPAGKSIEKKNEKPVQKTENEFVDQKAIARGDQPMTIVEHLSELRSRLIIIVISFFIFVCAGFYFSDILLHIINRPFVLTGNKLHIFTLAGGFIVRMKVAAAVSLLLLIPLIIYQVWRFISPAIEVPDRRFSRVITVFATLLFYSGIIFVFFVLPSAIKVLLGFINNSMFSTIGANDYLHFIFFLSFVMGILFELPVLILILTRIGLITPHFLIRKRKYAFIIIWVVAAVVTPGSDILSQTLIGVPLMLLYEVSIVISKFVLIRKKRKELIHKNNY